MHSLILFHLFTFKDQIYNFGTLQTFPLVSFTVIMKRCCYSIWVRVGMREESGGWNHLKRARENVGNEKVLEKAVR